jgi:2-dehydro-3-deoxyphosphogluconate aldolase/(4S)-4-hydroxy-2-oxoglutarate aldolase
MQQRHRVINTIYDLGLIPIFYNGDHRVATNIVTACLEGGASVIEFTNRGAFAHQVFAELSRFVGDKGLSLILGAGSVLDAPTAALYINNGAGFIVAPSFNPEVATLCNRRKVLYVPGCGSVTEISRAHEYGAEFVKVFPGSQVGGPGFVKAVRGPMPWTSVIPTGGVEPTWASIKGWIEAGAAALGIGSKLISKDVIANEDWEELKKTTRACLDFVAKARNGV